MLENVRMAFQGIWSHKMRSFLTMLGIIIGIAAIIAIVSTITGTNKQIQENLVGSGDNTVNIKLQEGSNPYDVEYQGIPVGVPALSDDTMKKLEKLEGVESVATYVSRYMNSLYYLSKTLEGGEIRGVSENYFDTGKYVMQKGRSFNAEDFKNFRKVVIMDEDSAYSLFEGEEPLGKTIEIQKEPFVVIGIVGKMKEFEPTINSLEDYYNFTENDVSGAIYIPDSIWPLLYQYDEPQNVILGVKSTDYMTNAGRNAEDILNATLNTKEESTIKYKAEDLLKKAKDLQQMSNSTNSMLIWVAGISLLVGGIGVMNIMLVSVTERTQEIGLKKAIGARKGAILWQFLTEAAVLTSLGGIIGVGSGIGLAQIISRVSGTPVAISVPAAIGSVIFSMVIGVVFGMLPSYKAANLNPIDALRHE